MNSLSLPPEEFWFYRVFSEWTLAQLHRVNNELTGALFKTEEIESLAEGGGPVAGAAAQLSASLQKILGLISETARIHSPPAEMPSREGAPLREMLAEASATARLLLPKSVKIEVRPGACDGRATGLPGADVRLLFAACAVLCHPPQLRTKGAVTIQAAPAHGGAGRVAVLFRAAYEGASLGEMVAQDPARAAGVAAIGHRMRRLGGDAAFDAAESLLRLELPGGKEPAGP